MSRKQLWDALEEACKDLTHCGIDKMTGPVHAANVARKAADYLKAVEPPMPKEARHQKVKWGEALKDPDVFALLKEKGLIEWTGGEDAAKD